ncbi:MAG: hypothetical protein IKQ17_05985 [Kiritimatiellae bacterium]|nr:hypothetical protein [Kiritimatiellia bacterium]
MKRLFAINAILFVALAAHCAPLATENFVTNKIAAAISQIPPPDFSTNNTELVETIEATSPAPGDYAAVSNAAMTALSRNEAEAGYTKWRPYEEPGHPAGYSVVSVTYDSNREWTVIVLFDGEENPTTYSRLGDPADAVRITFSDHYNSIVRTRLPTMADIPTEQINAATATNALQDAAIAEKQDKLPYPTNAIPYAAISGKPSLATVATSGSYNDLSNKPTIPTVPTEQIDAATTTNALQDTAIGDLSNDNEQTRLIVTTWENFLDGSNVVFSITNYLSGSYNLDAAKLRILELREGEYHEVYNSRDEILLHIDDFSNRYVRVALDAIVDEVAARLASKADRDWGKYTSAGGDAPANTVYMTAPNTVFAGGLEYERVAVGEGTICVLTTRGAPVWTQGDEGTFKFQDDGGTNYFGFAKTDSYTIGANTDGITVQGGMVTMNYNITMSGRPCVWYKSSLSSGAWEQLNLPDGSPVAGASHAVTWEANPDPGTQVCYINVGNAPSGFFRATVEVTGEAKFMTNMPADLSGGWICPNTATDVNGVVKPSFNGSSVIWTWSAN